MGMEARSPRMCSHQTGEPGEWTVYFQVQVQKPENQKSRWCEFQSESESESKGRRRPMSKLTDSQAEITPSPAFWFYSMDWVRPTYTEEGNLPDSIYLFKCFSYPEIPSETPRILFNK